MKLSESLVLGKARVDSLVNVKNLNVWGNSLSDISVIQKMPNIEVASLSVNCIDSLKDFSNCFKLQELYLRKNQITELSEITHLKNLKNLRVLWLSGNPCSETENYRLKVISVLDQLDKLDDDDISPDEKMRAALFSKGGLEHLQEKNTSNNNNNNNNSNMVNVADKNKDNENGSGSSNDTSNGNPNNNANLVPSIQVQQPTLPSAASNKSKPSSAFDHPLPKRVLHRDNTPIGGGPMSRANSNNSVIPNVMPPQKPQILIPKQTHQDSDEEEDDEGEHSDHDERYRPPTAINQLNMRGLAMNENSPLPGQLVPREPQNHYLQQPAQQSKMQQQPQPRQSAAYHHQQLQQQQQSHMMMDDMPNPQQPLHPYYGGMPQNNMGYVNEPAYGSAVPSVHQSQHMPYMLQPNNNNGGGRMGPPNRPSSSHANPYAYSNNNNNYGHQQHQQQPQMPIAPNRNNILTAVLSLLQELDPERLRIVQQECNKLTMYQ